MALQNSEKKPATKREKIVSGIVTGVCILIFIIAAVLVILTVVAKKNNRPVALFGYSFSIVQTDSMEPEIHVGEFLVTKNAKIEQATVGKNAVFVNSRGMFVVHKVVHTGEDGNGIYLVTKGVNASAEDDEWVHSDNFIGLAVSHSVAMGKIVGFLVKPVNWIIILAVVVGIPAIAICIKKVVVYAKEAKQSPPEAPEEKAEALDEREKMKAELLKELQAAEKKAPEESNSDEKDKKEE